jgi:hypothetical protein
MGAAKKTGARRWLMRGAIAAVAGLVIGGAGGVVTVRTFEPGRANAVDSVQAVLDSIARGTIAAERAAAASPLVESAEPAPTVADSAGTNDALLAVPDVIGLEEGPARDQILEAGLLVGDVQFRASTRPAGIVLSTTPPAGSLLAPSSLVALVLSDGRSPADTLLLPQRHPVP